MSDWEGGGLDPAGSWSVAVTEDGAPGYDALLTLAAGGVLLESDRHQLRSLGGSSPGHGAWQPVGGGRFRFHWVRLDRNMRGDISVDVRGEGVLDGDADGFSAGGVIETVDAAGRLLGSHTFGARGRRIDARPSRRSEPTLELGGRGNVGTGILGRVADAAG